MERPEVQQFGEAVILTGRALLDTRWLITRGIREARRDGIEPHTRLRSLVGALNAAIEQSAAMSQQRLHEVANDPNQSDLLQQNNIDTKQAAQILRVGVRQVQRIAKSLSGQRIGKTWSFDRHIVEAYERDRRTTE